MMWTLRISLNGVSKSVEVEERLRVAELVAAARRAFHVEAVSLSGGFPPKALDEDAVISEVLTNRALLRAVAAKKTKTPKKKEEGDESKPTTKRKAPPRKQDDDKAKSKKTEQQQKKESPASSPDVGRRRSARPPKGSTLGTAEGLTGALTSRRKEGMFFREALKGALAGAYETSKANDRFLAATVSKDFRFQERRDRLDGQVSSLEVDFAETSAGARTRRRHKETVDRLDDHALAAVVAEVVASGDGDMLVPANLARCSPRVLWNLVYSSSSSESSTLEEILEKLLPSVDWDAAFRGEKNTQHTDLQVRPAAATDDQQRRDARLRAAEARQRRPVPPEAEPEAEEPDDVDAALLACLDGSESARDVLARGANVTAPRDLALWRDCGGVLRDIITDTLKDEVVPPAADLERWAKTAADLLHARPDLADFLAAPALGRPTD